MKFLIADIKRGHSTISQNVEGVNCSAVSRGINSIVKDKKIRSFHLI